LPGKRKLHIDRALDNLKKAVELNPNNYDTYYSISGIYNYIGKDIEARDWEKKGQKVENTQEGNKKK
jgi:Tfp pilus assembly protein PilF